MRLTYLRQGTIARDPAIHLSEVTTTDRNFMSDSYADRLYETRLARALKNTERPTMRELIQDGDDLDSRVVLEEEPEPLDSDEVPEDTVPGE